MDTQLKKGLIEVCVLVALKQQDSYGYQIIKDVSPYAELSESTLYPILKRLQTGGCITSYTREHNSRLRKYYHITGQGIGRIEEFLVDWQDVTRAYEYIADSMKEGAGNTGPEETGLDAVSTEKGRGEDE